MPLVTTENLVAIALAFLELYDDRKRDKKVIWWLMLTLFKSGNESLIVSC